LTPCGTSCPPTSRGPSRSYGKTRNPPGSA
jgi:hypothetical protein